ncbi:MAG: autotransporter-associated beta strand repeat-containing protein [Chthoniobacteraceae bacterium]
MISNLYFPSVAVSAALALSVNAHAASHYIYQTTSGVSTQAWTTGAGWNVVPVSGSDTALTFIGANSTLLSDAANLVSNNDLGGIFTLNTLDLQGTGASSGTSSITIQGGVLQFVKNGTSGPVVNLNALKGIGTNSALLYTVSNNIVLADDTTFTGNGTAGNSGTGVQGFFFSGAFSGTGNLIKAGSSQMNLSGTSNSFAYAGNLDVQAGTLRVNTASSFYTLGGANVASGATLDISGTAAVSSLVGSGTITGSGAGSLVVNYVGSDTDYFTGTFNGLTTVTLAGSGDLSLPKAAGTTTTVINAGTGMLITPGVVNSNASARGVTLYNSIGVIKLTGTSGLVLGRSSSTFYGGTLWIAPTTVSSDANITVTGGDGTQSSAGVFRILGGTTIKLDKGGNNSVKLLLGPSSTTANPIFSRSSQPGTVIIDPVTGSSDLGGSAKLVLQNGVMPIITNGIANSAYVVVDNDTAKSADFVTYVGSGSASDTGFTKASYTNTFTTANSFMGTTNASVVKNTASQTISSNTSVYALRNDALITINSGITLTLGNPAGATHTYQTGLILNGGTISGGILAFGATEATIYTSGANGTINSKITSAGTTDNGFGTLSGGAAASLTKFGEGTLFLTNTANTIAGTTFINGGAIDVGTISNKVLPDTSNIRLTGGVLQGNGSLTRSLGTAANNISWNGAGAVGGGGGFAARGGTLTVNLGGAGAKQTWGLASTANFLQDTDILIFGSNTSDSQVDYQNAIDLGSVVSSYLYRTIYVKQGTGTDSAMLSGVISSTVTHGLLKDGAGTLILSANNTYSGGTVISEGTLQVGNGGASGSLSTGAVSNNGALVFKRSDAAPVVANVISGTGTLTQAGTGTTTLTGANTYTGNTVVNSGKLIVNGSIGYSAVNVNVGGTLGGSGTTGALTVYSGGVLAPGNSPGKLTVESATFFTGSTLAIDLQSDSSNGSAGLDWDQLVVNGVLDLTNVGTHGITLSLEDYGFTTWDGSVNHTWTSIISFDSITGFQSDGSQFLVESNTAFSGSGIWSVVQDGNELDLQYQVVPEPSTWAILVGGFGMLALGRHLRRQSIT